MSGPDEFETIARLLRPLADGAPEGLNLADDAAVIPQRPGYDLIVTKDAIVEGVHFLPGTPLDLVARKLLRVNLSDLAAKGAVPYGYFLACVWPDAVDWTGREAFAAGLAADQQAFGLKLFGGDTVSTAGPLVLSVTMMGYVEAGHMVRRDGAKAGDLVQVSGPIGDGWLGLQAARGGLTALAPAHREALIAHYQLPVPRLDVSLGGAHAACDVSDGLIADAAHIAKASGVGLQMRLGDIPLSPAAEAWLELQDDEARGLADLATGGDDYQIVAMAPAPMPGFTVIGEVGDESVEAAPLGKTGWRHGNLN